MKDVYSVLFDIAKAAGTNAKIEILKEVKNDKDLERDFLRIVSATLNPYINFYIKSYKLTDEGSNKITDSESLEVLRKISSREVTGNAAKKLLETMGNSLHWQDQLILQKIIAKKFNNGISTTTINKIWPGKIPVFNVMLCHPLNERSIKEIKFPCFVQVKYDAARVTVIAKENKVRYFTRNGKEYLIENAKLDKVFTDMLGMLNVKAAVFDGELYKAGSDRVSSNSVATKFVRGTASKTDSENVSIVLWDLITFEDFIAGKSKIPYEKRLNQLDRILHTFNNNSNYNHVTVAATEVFTNLDDIREYNAKLIAAGEEGVIIKNYDGIWEAKRSYQSIKMKEELETELRVVGVAGGLGKYVNLCGALQCESEDGLVTVSVGTGLTDARREEFKPNPNKTPEIIGKIITVRHNGIIKDVHGNHSLYLPRFIEVRFDKDIADDINKIKNEGK